MDALFLARPGQNEGRGYMAVSRADPSIAFPVASTYDGAEPSATSVAVGNLLRLGALTAEAGAEGVEEEDEEEDGLEVEDEGFAQRAGRLLALALQAPETPYEAPELLGTLSLYGPGAMQVILAGRKGRCGCCRACGGLIWDGLHSVSTTHVRTCCCHHLHRGARHAGAGGGVPRAVPPQRRADPPRPERARGERGHPARGDTCT